MALAPLRLRRAIRRGLIHATPLSSVIIPIALPFGVAASGAGLTLVGTAGFSVPVIAGAVPGRAIPAVFAPDVAVPITFPAMIAPTLRRLPRVAAA